MTKVSINTINQQTDTQHQRMVLIVGAVGTGLKPVCKGFELLGVDFFLQPHGEDAQVIAEINGQLAKCLDKNWRKIPVASLSQGLASEPYATLQADVAQHVQSGFLNSRCLGLIISEPYCLPFWIKLLTDLNTSILFVLQHRNPLSIAFSWAQKQAMPPEKSHYLWLEALCAGFNFSQGFPRIVLDYDDLLDNPDSQIIKMINLLGMHSEQVPAIAENFSHDLINPALRHSSYTVEDVKADLLVPLAVKRAVVVLEDIRVGKLGWDSEQVSLAINELAQLAEPFAATLLYTSHENLDTPLEATDDAVTTIPLGSQRNLYIGLLHQSIAENQQTLDTLKNVSELQATDLASLNQHIDAMARQIDQLMQQLIDKNAELIQSHRKAMELADEIKDVKDSAVWNILKTFARKKTMPLHINSFQVDAIPMHQITAGATAIDWLSGGEDPQFALVAGKEWVQYIGWNWLTINLQAGQPLNGQLFFNVGYGYTPELTLNVLLQGTGPQRIPVFVSKDCCAIRFDPCEIPIAFKLFPMQMTPIKAVPELPAEFSSQFRVYEAMGAREGNITVLEPVNTLVANSQGGYSWKSEGSDPWFLLQVANGPLQPGWYLIELCIHASISRDNAKLYFDFGEGYSEDYAVELPFVSGKTLKRLYQLPATPLQIRFDPVESEVRFSFQKLNFQPVAQDSVHGLMLERLQAHDRKYKNKSVADIERRLSRQASKENSDVKSLILQKYNKTFISHGAGGALTYAEWIEINERPEIDDTETLQAKQSSFDYRPIISIVVPVYNTGEVYLRSAIESVIKQSYPNWELCIADDASPDSRVREVLAEYANNDPRIKVVYRKKNGHISAASNSALELATGDFVALLDHDDELSAHALHFVVQAINQHPSANILYSDEDKIDEQGNRAEPHFKSDWNPDLFFSQNYVSHLGVYRKELLTRIGGFRLGVEGSQDQDLLLRCLPFIKPDEVIHIPKVLYHWRILEGSTALDSGEKTYTLDAGIKALQDYFQSLDKTGVSIEPGMVPNTYRVRYPIPEPQPLVSLLIPTRDMLSVLKPCIDSIIEKTSYSNYEILILDNGSVEPATLAYFESIKAQDKRVKIVPYDFPFNYSAINNYGAKFAQGELIGLVNNDVEVISPEWLSEMVSQALRPEIGCVGAKLYYDDNTIQHAGVIIGLGGVAGHSHKHFPRNASGYFHRLKVIQNLSSVTAACLVLRKSVYDQVGGLEEDGLKVAFNDVDFCLKVREAGYRNLWTPYAELYHYESKSRGYEDTPEKIARFNTEIDFIKNKWGVLLQRDPFYSQNLTIAREDFSL